MPRPWSRGGFVVAGDESAGVPVIFWKGPAGPGSKPPAGGTVIRSLTSLTTRHAWKFILLWTLLAVALSMVGQAKMHSVTQPDVGSFLPKSYDSAAAMEIAEDKFGAKPDDNAVTVLVGREDGKKLTGGDRRHIDRIAAGLGERRVQMANPDDLPSFLLTDHSQTPVVKAGAAAPDGTFRLLSVSLDGNMNDPALQDLYRDFRDHAEKEFGRADLRTGFTGGLADIADTTEAQEDTEKLVAILTFGLIVLLNVLAFRSFLAAVLPLLAVALVGGAATGAVVGTALLFDFKLDPSTPSLITVVLLGIGIDYFLFMLFRFRELLRAEPGPDQNSRAHRRKHARGVAAACAGRVGAAITSAALTIVAAFATLGIASFGQFKVLGPAIAVCVLVMLVASLTFMPALLAVCGRGMFWPSRALRQEPRAGLSARLGERVARRPLLFVAASVGLLCALSAGALGMRMDYGTDAGPDDTPAAVTAKEISRALPGGVASPHTVYVAAADGKEAAKGAGRDVRIDPSGLKRLTKELKAVEGVGRVAQPVLNGRHTAAKVDFYLDVDVQSQRARDLVSDEVRPVVAQQAPPGTEAHVSGQAAIFADVSEAVSKDLKVVFPVAAVLIALILVALLRSLLAPMVLMLAIGLGFTATLGSGVLVFQHILDRPGVSFTLPLVLFLFVVALGTDYNILISDRIREEMGRPGSARQAVAAAVRHTAPAIVTAGIVLAGSFASLAVNPSPGTQEIGLVTALGIGLSSLVLSIVLVPAVVAMLGRATWWPSKSGRAPGGHRAPRTSAYVPYAPHEPSPWERPHEPERLRR
ncbi:MMPL family transporter [Streptomyces aurantiacus]|uniref:Putative membrane protein n=1 Tax=Streptomyces aurantiacus JA 4570 TaxID=1286094 RepID=S3ZF70_9ACTN|nr:MMPL family transporter [Streptomyces aurantiacus]EPH41798.1 putative membrane protein [Streptomyces aurantiacus JA 4570]